MILNDIYNLLRNYSSLDPTIISRMRYLKYLEYKGNPIDIYAEQYRLHTGSKTDHKLPMGYH
jgi:hypothetical protein